MNRLPPHRSALYGRTFNRTWSAADFDPIQHAHRVSPFQKLADVFFAVVIGTLGAVALVAWWAA